MDLIRRNTVGDALRRAARLFRGRSALVFGDRDWSFTALDQAADRVAGHFAALGLNPGDRIAAYGRNSDAYFIAFLACLRGGFVHVPVNYALTGEELSYIVNQSGSRLVLVGTGLEANLKALDVRSRPIMDLIPVALDPNAPVGQEPDLQDDSLAQIVYTSGTTAAPKGAMMTHKAMMSQYYSVIHNMDYTETDQSLAALPLYHTAQMHGFMLPQILVGVRNMLIEAPAPEVVLRLIEQEKITSFFAPPTVWISLLRHPDFATRDLTSLEKVYYGASIMPVPVLHELRERLPKARPYNCYGQTEIAPLATVLRPEEHDARPASCGRPCLNVQTRVVDPDMNDVPPGTHGEIVHRSPHLMVGYWDKPAETVEAFAGGWFHSGDVGYFDAEGYLYIVDRIRDVINTGGVLVASREVEEVLFTHPAVSEVAVVGLPDDKWIEAVSAFVVLRPGHQTDEATLIALAREHLAPYKLPKKILFVDNLPRNTAGKLLKRELRKQYS
ncbi:MAG TPA: acyl-CoA synthetase [Acetobacteraceae bacterium]|jgi:fatty-acyl-CoA synthase|nr:acyl-CoA synthetase [Acetobacteraceae bacterium]